MKSFVLLSFVFLGFAFFALSGGASFDPDTVRDERVAARVAEREARIEAKNLSPVPPASQRASNETVSRVSLNLASLDEALETETPAPVQAQPETPTITDAPVEATARLTIDREIVLPSIVFPGSRTAAASGVALGPADIRFVSGTNVNVRGGPGTDFSVVNQLDEGEQVEILDDPGNGWVQLRPVNGGPVGWMADFLLSAR